MCRSQLSVFPGRDCFRCKLKFGKKGKDLSDHQLATGFPSHFDHSICSLRINRNRFFDQDVFASIHGCNGQLFVLVIGHANINQVDVWRGEHLSVVVVGDDLRQVEFRAARTEVSLN